MNTLRTVAQKIGSVIFTALLFASFSLIDAQIVKVETKSVVSVTENNFKRDYQTFLNGETSAEKSIVVDAKVNVSLCVAEGNLKINGWERNEIRAFVANGSDVGFKIQEKNKQNNVVWLMVTGSDSAKNKTVNGEECLSGETIELDVPRGAVVNVKGNSRETSVESVRKATVKIVGGNIFLNNIEQGIHATTYEGDVTVENSGGAITLETANGNIVAFGVAPSEIGDIFKAKSSSGAITLQKIEHRQTEINSNSGSIRFHGGFQNGGQYIFQTQNGTISLAIPEKSSFKINASYGFGAFNSAIKLENIIKNNANRAQSLSAILGTGDANVNLTTYSGAIRIKKQ